MKDMPMNGKPMMKSNDTKAPAKGAPKMTHGKADGMGPMTGHDPMPGMIETCRKQAEGGFSGAFGGGGKKKMRGM